MERIAEPDALQLEFSSAFPSLVLASSSPNRKALLEKGGTAVSVFVPGIEEEREGRTSEEIILNIAAKKIECYVKSSSFESTVPAVAADTMVLFSGRLIGKPSDRADAERILRALSGRRQTVITAAGLYLPGRGTEVFLDKADVLFRTLSDDEIEDYLNTGEWAGAAGGYRLQKTGYKLVEKIEGDWTTVVGLPLRAIMERALS